MNRSTLLWIVLGLCCVLVSCEGDGSSDLLSPEILLVNGKVITVDPDDSIAQAVAIRDGKIMLVGSDKELLPLAGDSTRIVDLEGLTVTPGLIDVHCHFAIGGTAELFTLDLSFPAVKNLDDMRRKIEAKVESLEPGEWIFGRGWDEGKLEELRYIYPSDIDPVAPNNPVFLMHTMGHYGTANTAAMKLAGVTKATQDPQGGTIDRDLDGSPTGVFKETAMRLVTRLVPDTTQDQMEEGIKHLVKGFNSEGMTSAKDPGIGPETWKAYQKVLAEDELNVRLFALWSGGRSVAAAKEVVGRVAPFTRPEVSTGDDRLISGGIKLFLDGSGGARTAWLYDEWSKDLHDIDRDNYGYPVVPAEEFSKMVKLYHDAGMHISVHAIGDKAIDVLMDAYSEALEGNPAYGRRHGIIHCNIPTDEALDRIAAMQQQYDAGYPEAEAVHMWWIGDTYAGNFGPERNLRMKPYRSFLDRGIKWAATSDYYVDPFPARFGIWAQITRETLLGVYGKHPFGQEESVDVRSALKAYTIWAAHQLFMEDKIGSIEVGKYADLAVWDKDLYTIPAAEIKDLECQMTLLGGEIVYLADDAPLTIN